MGQYSLLYGATRKNYRHTLSLHCISQSHFLEHSMPLFSKLHILQVNEIMEINISKQIHETMAGLFTARKVLFIWVHHSGPKAINITVILTIKYV